MSEAKITVRVWQKSVCGSGKNYRAGKTGITVRSGQEYARGQHIGVTAAVNRQGKMCFELTKEQETFTANVFLRFIKKLRTEYPRKCLSLIVDGAPAHKAKMVKDFVANNAGWLQLEILPPYSPELNPTEKSWRFVKTKKLNAMMVRDKKELRKAALIAMRKTKKDTDRVTSFFDK